MKKLVLIFVILSLFSCDRKKTNKKNDTYISLYSELDTIKAKKMMDIFLKDTLKYPGTFEPIKIWKIDSVFTSIMDDSRILDAINIYSLAEEKIDKLIDSIDQHRYIYKNDDSFQKDTLILNYMLEEFERNAMELRGVIKAKEITFLGFGFHYQFRTKDIKNEIGYHNCTFVFDDSIKKVLKYDDRPVKEIQKKEILDSIDKTLMEKELKVYSIKHVL